MEKHFKKLMALYIKMAKLDNKSILNPRVLKNTFDSVFGTDRTALDAEWRSYMRRLKTDRELITGEK